MCTRSESQFDQRQPLVHAKAKLLKQLTIENTKGGPLTAHRGPKLSHGSRYPRGENARGVHKPLRP